ncbi:MAG: cupredoxin domain-containing protein [Nitrososphaeraceae archaeon]|jgi:plastocyanin
MWRNNIIAIVAISFTVVGALWGIGNLLNTPEESAAKNVEGVLLIAENDIFNKTNPDIQATVDIPKKISILNKDFRRHDFIVDGLNINTAYLSTEQSFTTAIASRVPGTFEYYCSLHPDTMRGRIIIGEN